MTAPHWPALLKRATLAKYLEVSLPSLEKELAGGRLPRPIMFGGTLHWRKSEVDKAIEGTEMKIAEIEDRFAAKIKAAKAA